MATTVHKYPHALDVLECLRHLDPASTVEMRIIDAESPIVFVGDNEYLHMVMTLTEED